MICIMYGWGAATSLFTHFGKNGQKPILTQKEWEFGGGSSESLGVIFGEESKNAITFTLFLMHKP